MTVKPLLGEHYYPYRNFSSVLSLNHVLNSTPSFIENVMKELLCNAYNNDVILNIITTGSEEIHLTTNIISAPPQPPNLSILSNAQNFKPLSTSNTVTLSSTPLHSLHPPTPPPLPNNLSLIFPTNKNTNKEKKYPSTKKLNSETPVKACTETFGTTASPYSSLPPPLPISLTRTVPFSPKDPTTLLKQTLSQQVGPPPQFPPVSSSLRKANEKIDLSVDTSTDGEPGHKPLPLTLNIQNLIRLR